MTVDNIAIEKLLELIKVNDMIFDDPEPNRVSPTTTTAIADTPTASAPPTVSSAVNASSRDSQLVASGLPTPNSCAESVYWATS